jgi:adenylate kinase family enzyme
VRRVVVTGISGSGKTTLARRLATALDVPNLELDAEYHLPGWVERPLHDFRAVIDAHTSADAWVVDGSYHSQVSDLTWGRADTVVWLDPPRWRGMWRVTTRTLRRLATREELWNGNREPWTNLLPWRPPEQNIIRWAWTRHAPVQERMLTAADDPAWAHLDFRRLRSDADADRLVAEAGASARGDV